MSNITGTVRAVPELPTDPEVFNFTATLANTEYSHSFSTRTKQFSIGVRGIARLQFSFVTGESATNFITVSPGCVREIEGISYTGSIYFQVSKPGMVVEILEWT